MEDNIGCKIHEVVDNGIKKLYMENNLLKVSILTGKGSDIYEIIYKPQNMDILLKTKEGLNPYKDRNLYEHRLTWYSELFTGGWQDVLPHRGVYEDIEITQQIAGIAATLPWDYEIMENSQAAIRVKCFVTLPVVPLYVEKTFCLQHDAPKLYINETIKNIGESVIKFTWTQHSAFGGEFLDENVEIGLPSCIAFKAADFSKENRQDLASYEEQVDEVTLANGNKHSLLKVNHRNANEELFITLKNLEQSQVVLFNKEKQVGVRYCWDPETFPYIRYWYKNSEEIYTVAIEPSNDYFLSIKDSLAHGTYLSLQPGQEHSTWLTCEIFE